MSSFIIKVLFNLLKILFLIVIPFIVFIRGSVYIYEHHQMPTWIAFAGGAIFTSIVLALYFSMIYRKITGRFGSLRSLRKRIVIALILILGYSFYGLLFVSADNAKHEDVRKEFTRLHPIIRLGVSTLIFIDPGLIITDASRVPEDYRKMGLKTNKRSLHYKQSDGYVHALDIRTNNRSEWRNFLIKTYFHLMGFNTLRHGGTGDHLHVSLYSPDNPGGI